MDKGREKGILKLDPRPKMSIETRSELTPQGSCEVAPASPQPSVDRLSVTWADPDRSMASAVNLFHPEASEVKFSQAPGEGSEDEDYSASLNMARARRASVRRSRKGRARRPSSPFLGEERVRRRSSVFTTSSGDTAISIEEAQPGTDQEQIFENIHLHKEVLVSVKQQAFPMTRKIKLVHQAKTYIKRHEGQLQERLAQSKSTRDIYARFNILLATKWQQLKREFANTSNLLIPWELRIKEIESHFGSVVASYFTFLRWLFWVNLVIGFILLVFVIVPEYLTADPDQDGERKIIMEEERRNASNLLTLWEFEGILKYSPIFYGYYSNLERPKYRMPLAYFLTGLVVYIYSFVAILRKMAENSRMSKLSEKEDECIFSWKLFTGWDFMIGNAETAHNRIASVILGFKEALLEEAEKKKDLRNWRIISLRALVNICVLILLALSAYAVVTVVSHSDTNAKSTNWWSENETSIVVTVISIMFPLFFELLGFLEHYHPRKQLRLQLARIMLLNLLNLYSLIFALIWKIDGMSKDLNSLKPNVTNTTAMLEDIYTMQSPMINENLTTKLSVTCYEITVSCAPCNSPITFPTVIITSTTNSINKSITTTAKPVTIPSKLNEMKLKSKNMKFLPNMLVMSKVDKKPPLQNLLEKEVTTQITTTTEASVNIAQKELERLRKLYPYTMESEENSSESTEMEIDTTTDISVNVALKELERLKKMFPYTIDSEESSSESGDADTDIFGFHNYDDTLTTFSSSDSKTEYTGMKTEHPDSFFASTASFIETVGTDYGIDSTSKFTEMTSYNTDNQDITTQTYGDTISYSISKHYSQSLDNNKYSSTATDAETDSTSEKSFTISTQQNEFESSFVNTRPTEIVTTNEGTTMYDDTATDLSSSVSTFAYSDSIEITEFPTIESFTICPNISFNCTVKCGDRNVTQVFYVTNCTIVEKRCFTVICKIKNIPKNTTLIDVAYEDEHHRKVYNLTIETRKKLLKLCWETMFGQELIKLTMMDLVFVVLGTLFMDFFRALFVRYMNRCWCWDLEKKFPEYGDFKIAENILHLINNQGLVWMGMFFSPGLVVLNVSKLMIIMYLRSWAVMTCNVPHEVVFRVSKSNNFYLALLLTMLFLCVLPVGYTIVWVRPSWHCGPFSEYDKIYSILTDNIYKILPKSLNFALEYIASPAMVIPLLVLLVLIIYYLTSLTNSLREANNDLKIQLRRERTEERRKMFQLADTRRRVGSIDTSPYARWKKALPSLPISKSIDSDERKAVTGDENGQSTKSKKKGGIFAKIVSMALDKKSDVEAVSEVDINGSPSSNNVDDETDTDFHETLPKEVLKIKDIIIGKAVKKKSLIDFKNAIKESVRLSKKDQNLRVDEESRDDMSEKRPGIEKEGDDVTNKIPESVELENVKKDRKMVKNQSSDTSTQPTDSMSSVIPVITISTTESDDEVLQSKKGKSGKEKKQKAPDVKEGESSKNILRKVKNSSNLKSLRRQSSVDSTNEHKISTHERKSDDGHKYQYSL